MTGRTNSRPWLPYVLAAAAALMAALVYLNALNNPFVYDDHRVVLENYSIRDLSNVRALFQNDMFRPAVNISYAIDYARSGLQPFGYHLTSLLLHMANVVLLFILMRVLASDSRAMGGVLTPVPALPTGRKKSAGQSAGGTGGEPEVSDISMTAAFAAAAVWAVHPLMTQAVGYVSGRSEVLCALFVLIAFLCLRAWAFGARRALLALGIGAWVLALASKEVAAMLPVVLLTYDRLLLLPSHAPAKRRLTRIYLPMLAFVAVAGVARLVVFAGVENASRANFSWMNILVGLDVVRRYIKLTFLVESQSVFHTALVPSSLWRPLVILNVLWLLVLGMIIWLVSKRARGIAFGALWTLLMLLPSVTLLAVDVGEPLAEQRAYLAGCGVAIAIGAAFGRLWEWPPRHRVLVRSIVTVVLGMLLVVMASRTVSRNQVWSDPVRLWREAVANAPDIWLPHRGLGDALRDKGDFAGAAAAYAEAARLRPEEANTHLALGVSLLMIGRLPEADQALAEATRLSPGMEQAETARGMIARALGRRDEARDRFLAVARAHPNAVLARQHLAEMYENEYGDPTSALRMCREVQALAPQAEGVAECIRRNEQKATALPRGSDSR